jgi:transposase, IS30 family
LGNGKEFAKQESIADRLKVRFYLAHPYASWESGLNKNTNGLIRQCFTKKHSLATVAQKQTNRIMENLNNCQQKCLELKISNQVFFGANLRVVLLS